MIMSHLLDLTQSRPEQGIGSKAYPSQWNECIHCGDSACVGWVSDL